MNKILVLASIAGAIVLAFLLIFQSGAVGATVFKATLSGAEEVPPVNTVAMGDATFNVGEGSISFTLNVSNVTNATAAHIHAAAKGVNGPVVVPLFSGPVKQGEFTGVLAEGTITKANLAGLLAGMELGALVDMMNAGGAYVNVHTTQSPGGEMRGQIMKAP